MTSGTREPLELPLAELERQLIVAYLAGAGQELHGLLMRHDDDSKRLLKAASRYASERLCETLSPRRSSKIVAIAGSPRKPMPSDVSVIPSWQADR